MQSVTDNLPDGESTATNKQNKSTSDIDGEELSRVVALDNLHSFSISCQHKEVQHRFFDSKLLR